MPDAELFSAVRSWWLPPCWPYIVELVFVFVLLAPPMRSLDGPVAAAAAAASPCVNDDGRLGVDVATALPDVDDGFMS